jgi:hypothetical protein
MSYPVNPRARSVNVVIATIWSHAAKEQKLSINHQSLSVIACCGGKIVVGLRLALESSSPTFVALLVLSTTIQLAVLKLQISGSFGCMGGWLGNIMFAITLMPRLLTALPLTRLLVRVGPVNDASSHQLAADLEPATTSISQTWTYYATRHASTSLRPLVHQ